MAGPTTDTASSNVPMAQVAKTASPALELPPTQPIQAAAIVPRAPGAGEGVSQNDMRIMQLENELKMMRERHSMQKRMDQQQQMNQMQNQIQQQMQMNQNMNMMAKSNAGCGTTVINNNNNNIAPAVGPAVIHVQPQQPPVLFKQVNNKTPFTRGKALFLIFLIISTAVASYFFLCGGGKCSQWVRIDQPPDFCERTCLPWCAVYNHQGCDNSCCCALCFGCWYTNFCWVPKAVPMKSKTVYYGQPEEEEMER